MAANVSTTVANPTHHVSLEDKTGAKVGLILVDGAGKASKTAFARNPLDPSSLKTSQGNQTYNDFEPPYAPISQDDWSGGRGNRDFETATNRFFDSWRVRTSMGNKVFLGGQEQYSKGNRSQDFRVPGNVRWVSLNGGFPDISTYAVKFTASASDTATQIWVLIRKQRLWTPGLVVGDTPSITVSLCSNNAGNPDTVLEEAVISNVGSDYTSQWVKFTLSEALTATTIYWIKVEGAGTEQDTWWEIAASSGAGDTKKLTDDDPVEVWETAAYDLYYQIQDADEDNNCIYFEYKEMLYKVESHVSGGAPHLYRLGYRGAADSNAGNLNKLIDATQSWTVDALIGLIVLVTSGPGSDDPIPWRTITDNDATSVTVDTNWTTTHTTDTEYVILGLDNWVEQTGHGMTAPVTDVLVTTYNYVIFCQGNGVAVRHMNCYNNSGTWTNAYSDGSTSKAKYLCYAPVQKKVYRSLQGAGTAGPGGGVDQNQYVGEADTPTYSNGFTVGTDEVIGKDEHKITGLNVYQDDDGNEAIWVFKTDGVYIIPFKQPNVTDPNTAERQAYYQLSIANKLYAVRNTSNGRVSLRDEEYIWWNVLQGMERYYQGHLDDQGPNKDEGLPDDRIGSIVDAVGYPGRFFVAIDAGASGYSSILERDNSGWHERYRAPYGLSIKALFIQVVPGNLTRLWFFQGQDSLWIPLPNEGMEELKQSDYLYTHEGAVESAWMQAGMKDAIKFVRSIKLLTQELSANNQEILVEYKLDDDTTWTQIDETWDTSPWQRFDFGIYDVLECKRFKTRIRFMTTDATITPILEAAVYNMVSRTDQRNVFSLPVRIADNDRDLNGQPDDYTSADLKLAQLDAWASGETGRMLLMRSVDLTYDNRLVFLPAVPVRVLVPETDQNDKRNNKMYICALVVQDA